jgi:hypothetical protein
MNSLTIIVKALVNVAYSSCILCSSGFFGMRHATDTHDVGVLGGTRRLVRDSDS